MPIISEEIDVYKRQLPISGAARPGELVRTSTEHKNVHEFLRHDDEQSPRPIGHFHLATVAPF